MSVLRTFAGTFASRGGGFLLTILTGIVVSRTLGPSGKGEVDVLVMMAGLVVLVIYPSLEEPQLFLLGSRDARPPVLLANALVLSLVFGVAATLAAFAVERWWPDLLAYTDRASGERRMVDTGLLAVLVLASPLVVAHRLVGGLLQGMKAMRAFNLVQLSQPLALAVLVILLLVGLGRGVPGAALAHFVALALPGLLAIGLALRHPELGAAPRSPALRPLVRLVLSGLRLHGGVIAAFVIISSDQLILNRFHGPKEVGLYTVAVALTGHLRRLVLQPTKEVVGSRLPDLTSRPAYMASSLAKASRHLILLMAVPGAFLALLGLPVILLLYGEDFLPAYRPLLYLIPGSIFWSVAVILSYWLIGRDRYLTLTAVGALVAALNVAANLLWVPRFGMEAAALSSTACYLVHMAIFVLMASRGSGLGVGEFLRPRREDLAVYRDAWRQVAARLGRVR